MASDQLQPVDAIREDLFDQAREFLALEMAHLPSNYFGTFASTPSASDPAVLALGQFIYSRWIVWNNMLEQSFNNRSATVGLGDPQPTAGGPGNGQGVLTGMLSGLPATTLAAVQTALATAGATNPAAGAILAVVSKLLGNAAAPPAPVAPANPIAQALGAGS